MPGTHDCFSRAEPPGIIESERPTSVQRMTARQAVDGHVQRGELTASEAGLFWLESDSALGKTVLKWHDGERLLNLATPGLGSRVNGYGGGALSAFPDRVVAVTDRQHLISVPLGNGHWSTLVDNPDSAWGGLVADCRRNRLLAVREWNGQQALVAIAPDGQCRCLHEGADFYGAPALSPDGRRIAWVTWQLPDMPWLRTRLWLAELDAEGHLQHVQSCVPPMEGSIQQPVFAGQVLWVLSDHQGWWQPWELTWSGREALWTAAPAPAQDHANAPWQLGERHHCPLPGGRWARVRYNQGTGELWVGSEAALTRVATGFTDFRCLSVHDGTLYCVARSPARLDVVLAIDPDTLAEHVLAGGEDPLPGMHCQIPETFLVPRTSSEPAVQGFFYEPTISVADRPPVIFVAHGGPTSAVYPVYNPQIQFWCQRGFAVAEVNYRGSSGFGRGFRLSLASHWGEFDVQDMVRAARYLSDVGRVDGDRVFVQGRSAGGYTVLMALIETDCFVAGASLFGVTDPRRLRSMTHRFESGYLDWLLGAPEDQPERWHARTPLHHADRIRTPVIFFQGGQDRVVVPEQTRTMVESMKAAGHSPELHWFEDEAHGFRQPENLAAMLEWLHSFYRRHSRKANDCL
ncbi:prolyl oligopeptidase family serine peptidase [Marinobacter koreensis]|uniref:Prolyl oligopeptidase family serine peptidase n=1 Tax=Marinobacter koreensis TaxID=335974 RepID=A0ABW0RNG4_9GAMM|nr:prolyl oligopeptidase family serine peptidase [Marinobacter koreensis]MCK7547453.1 prolyl oligopeptidase family serine peptidase [Marinobacter koreensis]